MSTTENMLLDLPIVEETLSPDWATMLNEALEKIDAHDHTSNKGLSIPASAIDIEVDLSFKNNSLLDVESIELKNNSTQISTDSSLYEFNDELYFNDGNGNCVKLTEAGSINVAAAGGINGDYGGAEPATVSFSKSTNIYDFKKDSGTYSCIQVENVIYNSTPSFTDLTISNELLVKNDLKLESPGAGTKTISLSAPTGLVSDYSLVLPLADGTSSQILSTDGAGNLQWLDNSAVGSRRWNYITAGTYTWQAPFSGDILVYVVGGGGAGNCITGETNGIGTHGGAGGNIQGCIVSVTSGNNYTVVVGAGGTTGLTGGSGASSCFNTIVASGGGGATVGARGGAQTQVSYGPFGSQGGNGSIGAASGLNTYPGGRSRFHNGGTTIYAYNQGGTQIGTRGAGGASFGPAGDYENTPLYGSGGMGNQNGASGGVFIEAISTSCII
jgi:hypothetical protein